MRTVEAHRAHLQRKLGRPSRAELVRYALERGLLRALEDPRGASRVVAIGLVPRSDRCELAAQRGLIALMVDPMAPNFAALRRVSSKADRA